MLARDFCCYLPVNDEAIRWGIDVTSVGRTHIPADKTCPPAGHPAVYHFDWRHGRVLPEFALLFVTDGEGVFDSTATSEVDFRGPTVLRLLPGVWHRYRPRPDVGWTERWICFNGEIAHRLSSLELMDAKHSMLAIENPAPLQYRFDALLTQVHGNSAQNSVRPSLEALSLWADALTSAAEISWPTSSTVASAANFEDEVARGAIESPGRTATAPFQ